jgi:uncharacterized protein with von Willebrand factor type A (vWA) domain
MKGFHFSHFDPNENGKNDFRQTSRSVHADTYLYSGDVSEALNWLTQLDKQYGITTEEYGLGDFIDELKDKGYIDDQNENGEIRITPKTEQGIRKRSLEEIFGKLKKTKQGEHHTFKPGLGDDINPETRPYQFGDMLEQIDFVDSIRNAQINTELIHSA